MSEKTTHFGYQTVTVGSKAERVADVFDSVATRYDLMNDIMSAGIHRVWKHIAVEMSAVKPGHRVLDVAGGTGDMAARFARQVGPKGTVFLTDINNRMLQVGRDRLTNLGLVENVRYVQADVEKLPLPKNTFDIVCIAFGLRNVTNKDSALSSMLRVLKPGGRLLILEFAKPKSRFLKQIYDSYSFNVLPKLGKIIAHDSDSYRYLAESIRMHPDQESLKAMIEKAGFQRADYHNMTGGIVALHRGVKP